MVPANEEKRINLEIKNVINAESDPDLLARGSATLLPVSVNRHRVVGTGNQHQLLNKYNILYLRLLVLALANLGCVEGVHSRPMEVELGACLLARVHLVVALRPGGTECQYRTSEC